MEKLFITLNAVNKNSKMFRDVVIAILFSISLLHYIGVVCTMNKQLMWCSKTQQGIINMNRTGDFYKGT